MLIKILACFGLFVITSCATKKTTITPAMELKIDSAAVKETFLSNLLQQYPQFFNSLLKQNDVWQIKIVYTQIDRKPNNSSVFTHYYFNIDPAQYFYPASTVKMPIAFLALQKLNELKIPGLDKNSTMITEAE